MLQLMKLLVSKNLVKMWICFDMRIWTWSIADAVSTQPKDFSGEGEGKKVF